MAMVTSRSDILKFFAKKLLPILVLSGLSPQIGFCEIRSVVILPFANHSRVPGFGWMSESFPELLEERLKNPALNILGREERLLAFERIGIPYVSSLSKASLIKIAEELDAELLVLGEFTSDGKQIDVSASVLELRKGVLRPLIRESGLLDHFQQVCG